MKYSICIVGVDGTGKSTMVAKLHKALGEAGSCVQYMGGRLWETNIAKKYRSGNLPHGIKNSIMCRLSLLYEMYHRVKKHRHCNKIIIFDRYVDEQILLREQKTHNIYDKFFVYIYKLFLRKLFYQPDITFYLTCPLHTSIERKDDITSEETIERLNQNKKLLDAYYKSKPNVIIIDTADKSLEHTFQEILRNIPQEFRA